MRGWKVHYEPEQGILTVGPLRGKSMSVKVVGVGQSQNSGVRYLAYELHDEEELPDKHESALVDYLNKNHQGPWELVPAEVLNNNWNGLSPRERERLLMREGFDATVELP
ncbi:MAG: hypothetical protein HY319_09145 [Armatimonadetes bacterium]|nr:hypothetical protein [Armatimonadota bacterium]